MIFGKIFHLSKEGSKAIVQAGIWLALFNLAALLPVILLAMASEKMITLYYADSEAKISLLPYALALAVILAVMFVTYKVAYHKEYLTSGQEEYKLRMELADKLRRLPLSFLGMRDLSDVTGVIMDDVQTMSHVLSQTAAELIGGMITGIVSLLMLFVYDWRLALYLAACLPVVILVMSLSRKISEGTNKKNRNKKLSVSAGLQEYLENIKLLRTTEAMEDYQQGLNKKIKRIIPGLVLYELLAGLSISVSYNVMRIGLGLVIIFGSGMLAAGEISLFKFLIFLYAAVRIYEPLTSACEHLGDFIASLVGAGRVTKLLEEPEQGGSENVSVSSFDIRFDHVSFAYIGAIRELKKIIRKWKDSGKTILIAEHRLWWTKDLIDRVLIFREGEIAEDINAAEFWSRSPEEFRSRGLRSFSGFAPIKAGVTLTDAHYTISEFQYANGKDFSIHVPKLEIPKGAVVAVLGNNGAGKSTFAKCLCGLTKCKVQIYDGNRTYRGRELRKLSFMVFQDVNHQLFSESALEDVTLGLSLSKEEKTAVAEDALRRMNLADCKDTHPMALSGGQKQRLAIAGALAAKKELILYDEPTSGLDYRNMERVAQNINALAEAGKTQLVITHDPELVEKCCDYYLFFENGEIIEYGTWSERTINRIRDYFDIGTFGHV